MSAEVEKVLIENGIKIPTIQTIRNGNETDGNDALMDELNSLEDISLEELDISSIFNSKNAVKSNVNNSKDKRKDNEKIKERINEKDSHKKNKKNNKKKSNKD